MDINNSLEKIRKHPESERMGMIASHLGIVRGSSRDGRKVYGIEVKYNLEKLEIIINNIKSLPGIIEVIVEFNEGRMNIGDELLFVAVGGDIRENVFSALVKAVDMIKKRGAEKWRYLKQR